MNEFILHRDLHVDPLTRLKNFIQFIEEDHKKLFGAVGLICIFDIEKLREINMSIGREAGDKMITSAAIELSRYFDREAVFRTEGDAFTVILKGYELEDIEENVDRLTMSYNEEMLRLGFGDLTIHNVIYPYSAPIESIEDFYMFVVEKDNAGRKGRGFNGDQLVRHILGGVINRFKQSLEYYDEVYNYALIDEVSNLPNAKAANQYLGNKVSLTGRRTDQYAILFIDGDDLRRYNDVSYEAGNNMIRQMATIIKDASRDQDKVFRWLSGDEFVVVLDDTDHEVASLIAERMREQVVAGQDNFMFDTTISIGIASYPIDGHDVDQIIYYAEKANKIAKEQGKNQVVSWSMVDISSF